MPLSVSSTSSSIASITPSNSNSTLPDKGPLMSGGTALSTGAQAGIGAACGLFGLAAVLALWLLMIKRHKKRRGRSGRVREQENRLPDSGSTVPLVANKFVPSGGPGSPRPHEVITRFKAEVSAGTRAHVEVTDHEATTK